MDRNAETIKIKRLVFVNKVSKSTKNKSDGNRPVSHVMSYRIFFAVSDIASKKSSFNVSRIFVVFALKF